MLRLGYPVYPWDSQADAKMRQAHFIPKNEQLLARLSPRQVVYVEYMSHLQYVYVLYMQEKQQNNKVLNYPSKVYKGLALQASSVIFKIF